MTAPFTREPVSDSRKGVPTVAAEKSNVFLTVVV